MSDKYPHSLIRKVYIVLGVLIACALLYQNFFLYSITKSLRKSQSRAPQTELYLSDIADEVSVALAALAAENRTYKANLKQQGINLKECLSKLPQNEIDDFYRRHREELERRYIQ